MEIRTRYRKPLSVADYVELSISGDSSEEGRLETVEFTADHTCKAISRLIEWMSDRGMIDAQSVSYIVNGYCDTDVQFVQQGEE